MPDVCSVKDEVAPVAVYPPRVRVVPPELVRVKLSGALVWPTAVLGNARAAGEIVSAEGVVAEVEGATPLPQPVKTREAESTAIARILRSIERPNR